MGEKIGILMLFIAIFGAVQFGNGDTPIIDIFTYFLFSSGGMVYIIGAAVNNKDKEN